MNIASKLVERIKNTLKEVPQRAYETALNDRWQALREGVAYQRDEKVEADVLKDWHYAGLYAADVLEGQFRAFEIVIQTADPATEINDIEAVATYIKRFNLGIWPAAEKHLENDARIAFEYSRDNLRNRWPEGSNGDKVILGNSEYADKYRERFPLHFQESREQASHDFIS